MLFELSCLLIVMNIFLPLYHTHSHITPAVAAMMGSCFVLVRTHQHGIANTVLPQAAQTHVTREGCNLHTIGDTPVSCYMQATVEN